ncbi:hypothetical protein [Candidatus Tisiphia endosymbiont of Parasteatoda lunata]|uniref:hypothetical protein n=1 Tax=Candidatus Tisiphia endosymbiont of Parasteatoda lunata TaxID=3066275 RepID=UPI00313C33AB
MPKQTVRKTVDRSQLQNIDNVQAQFSYCIALTITCHLPLVNHSALQVQSLILRHECLMYVLT